MKGGVVGGTALGLPTIVPGTVFGGKAPGDRVNVGQIGRGGTSGYHTDYREPPQTTPRQSRRKMFVPERFVIPAPSAPTGSMSRTSTRLIGRPNLEMAAALNFAGYDYRLEYGDGGHDGQHGGAILPESLIWLWR